MRRITRITAIAALAPALLCAAPAIAQRASQAQMPTTSQQQQQQFSQAVLQKFVQAQQSLASIRADYRQQIQQAKGRAEMRQIRQHANQAMISAIKETGLSIEQFNKIKIAARNQPKLAQRIQKLK